MTRALDLDGLSKLLDGADIVAGHIDEGSDAEVGRRFIAARDDFRAALAAARERDGLRARLEEAEGLLREHLYVFGSPNFTDRGGYAGDIRSYFARHALTNKAHGEER